MATLLLPMKYLLEISRSKNPSVQDDPLNTSMTDDGADYIDHNWVLDYRKAIAEGKRKPDVGAVELGRTASGFLFRINDWETYKSLFVHRRKFPWGVKMPPAPRRYNEAKPKAKAWAGAPDFNSTYFSDLYQFAYAKSNLIFMYPFAIRSFKELVVVRPHQKMINRGDGRTDIGVLIGLPDDMMDKLAALADYKDRQSLLVSFDELAVMFHY